MRLAFNDDRLVRIGVCQDDAGMVTDIFHLNGRIFGDDVNTAIGPDMPDGG